MTMSTDRVPNHGAARTPRDNVLFTVAAQIAAVANDYPVRVAVDGVDAAGKTVFADELGAVLQSGFERTVVRASIDDFHNPRSVRLARGPDAPDGYYYDSFDLDTLMRVLLLPLGAGGNRWIRTQVFDFEADMATPTAAQLVALDSILLFDGVFLLQPALRPYWAFSVFLDVPFEITVARAVARDGHRFGDAEQIRRRYLQRYVPGQELYFAEAQPQAHAAVVIDNADFERPVLLRASWQDLATA